MKTKQEAVCSKHGHNFIQLGSTSQPIASNVLACTKCGETREVKELTPKSETVG